MLQSSIFEREASHLGPRAYHIPNWLKNKGQKKLLEEIRKHTQGIWFTPMLPNGTPMKHPIACVGWQWKPYEYFPGKVPVPSYFKELFTKALADAGATEYIGIEPDTGIVNWYPPGAGLGMHQDKSEDSETLNAGLPIVTISLGDLALFRFGNAYNKGKPYTDIDLHSGDLIVMAGDSRLNFHGVSKPVPETGPPLIGKPGRISLTLRKAKA